MRLLRNRNFTILFFGQLISTMGNNLFAIALPWYVFVLTGSKTDLALIGFFQALPALAGLFAGVWVDRWIKKRVMIGSDAIRAILALVLFGVAHGHGPFAMLILLVVLLQLAGTFFGPADGALLPQVVASEEVPAASGMLQSGSAFAQFAGMLSGGALIVALGAPLLFLLDGVSFAVSVVSLLFVRVREERPARGGAGGSRRFWREWRTGMAVIGRSSLLVRVMLASLVVNGALAPFDIMLTAWIKSVLRGTALDLAYVNAAFLIGITGGGFLVGPLARALQIRHIVVIGLTWLGVFIGAIAAISSVYWCVAMGLVAGVAVGALNGSLSAYMIQLVPAAARGRVFGALGALSQMAAPLGLAVFGTLMIRVPLPALFGAGGALSVAAGLSLLLPGKDDLSALVDGADGAGADGAGADGEPGGAGLAAPDEMPV